MANEAVIIELLGDGGDVVRYTCADGTSISKGTLCKLADPRTASATSANGDVFAGIACQDKVAGDGLTSIGCYTNGIFDLRTQMTITAGSLVSISGANLIKPIVGLSELSQGCLVGKAYESAASGTDETIAVRVGRML